MVTRLREEILAILDEPESVLVFPSEIVARFWRKLATEPPRPGAISERRVISWDRFKEQVFDLRRSDRPINSTLRRIFAASLLKENEGASLFAALVDPAYRTNSAAFTGYLQNALASLKALADRGAFNRPTRPILRDFSIVFQRYQDFLDQNGLFEPGWIAAGIPTPGSRHVVIFPRLIDDYHEFESVLDSVDTIETLNLPVDGPVPAVREFANAHQEVTAVLSAVEGLLDEGVAPDDIAISVAELDAYEPFLRRYAELHDLPLHVRRGRPLSEHTAGRFFHAVSQAVNSDFGFHAVRALISDRAVPWRDRTLCDSLVRAAVEGGCLKRKLGDDARDQWMRAIRAVSVDRAAVTAFYTELRDALLSVMSARRAADLRPRLIAFLQRFIDSDAWDRQNLKVYQRALEELKQLVAAESQIGHALDDPYSLWLGLLDQTLYVERVEHSGVPVFPYRVAAGIVPEWHFVVNASHDGTRVFDSPFRYLRDETREALNLVDRDFSDDFLAAYRYSGRRVSFSCSARSYAGPRFIAGPLAPSVTKATSAAADDYHSERACWASGLTDLPARVYAYQAVGLTYLERTGARPRNTDFSRRPIRDEALRQRLLRHPRSPESAAILLSANSIDSYRACPFGHLLSGPLRIEEPAFAVDVEPAKQIGTYQHAVLEQLYRRIGSSFSPDLLSGYLALLDQVVTESVDWSKHLRSVPASIAGVIRQTTRSGIAALLGAEAERIGMHQIEKTEFSESVSVPECDVVLNGRIDRVSRDVTEGSLILVDYKRKSAPARVKVVGRDGDPDTIETVQLLVYMLLLEDTEAAVERAYYYQVENGKIVPIMEPGGRYALDHDERERLVSTLKQIIASTATGMRDGDYRFPDPAVGCDGCRFRGICRAKFSVE